ncbi:phosphotransferase [Thioalkalivibrio sp. XN279]|uniref:phosphotransferase enzyme family protein n=1 Tax=Thioalkalivibrio sp. XN279 TaxID=2714953 RepID=UPI0019826C0E
MQPATDIDVAILHAWDLVPGSLRPLGTGLINRTFCAQRQDGSRWVLQQLNPMFPPEVHEDIEAVTAHLAARGMPTPRLLRTRDGRLCIPAAGGAWRVMNFMPGRVVDAIESPAQAGAAGRLLARFHRALDDLAYEFRHQRPPVHEPARHFAALESALATHPAHRLRPAAGKLAAQIFAAAAALPRLSDTPPRIVHGDPKISNLVFSAGDGEGLCLVDLDTLGRMALPFELGDAMRSWCSVSSEDDPGGRFCARRFGAAVAGYAAEARGWWTAEEQGSVLAATAIIQLELAARFCADALNESYFGWNALLFASRGDHNLARAQGQLALHGSLLAQRDVLAEALERVKNPA